MTSVAFALLQRLQLERAARGGEHYQDREARRSHSLALQLEREALPNRGLRAQQRLEGAMGERVA